MLLTCQSFPIGQPCHAPYAFRVSNGVQKVQFCYMSNDFGITLSFNPAVRSLLLNALEPPLLLILYKGTFDLTQSRKDVDTKLTRFWPLQLQVMMLNPGLRNGSWFDWEMFFLIWLRNVFLDLILKWVLIWLRNDSWFLKFSFCDQMWLQQLWFRNNCVLNSDVQKIVTT